MCIYVAKTKGDKQHEATCDEWKRLLDAGVRALLEQVAARCPMLAPSVARIEQLARGDGT